MKAACVCVCSGRGQGWRPQQGAAEHQATTGGDGGGEEEAGGRDGSGDHLPRSDDWAQNQNQFDQLLCQFFILVLFSVIWFEWQQTAVIVKQLLLPFCSTWCSASVLLSLINGNKSFNCRLFLFFRHVSVAPFSSSAEGSVQEGVGKSRAGDQENHGHHRWI